MISELISDDIPPQRKSLDMVIPIQMHFCSFVSNWSVAIRIKQHVIQRNVTILMSLFPTVYDRIFCRKFLTLSNWTSRYIIKFIRIQNNS